MKMLLKISKEYPNQHQQFSGYTGNGSKDRKGTGTQKKSCVLFSFFVMDMADTL